MSSLIELLEYIEDLEQGATWHRPCFRLSVDGKIRLRSPYPDIDEEPLRPGEWFVSALDDYRGIIRAYKGRTMENVRR